jgi:hypothetical protein
MSKRYFGTLVVGLVFVILVGWLVVQSMPSSESERPLTVRISNVAGITVTTDSGVVFALERREGEWWLVQPWEDWADSEKVGSLVSHLESLAPVRKPEAALDPAKYGLDQPRMTIGISHGSQRESTLEIGRDSPLGNKTFARLAEQPQSLLLVDRDLPEVFTVEAEDLRHQGLFRAFDRGDLVEVTIDNQGERLVLRHQPGASFGEWFVAEPERLLLDERRFNELLSELLAATASGFREKVESTGGAEEWFSLTLEEWDQVAHQAYISAPQRVAAGEQDGGGEAGGAEQVVYASVPGRPYDLILPAEVFSQAAELTPRSLENRRMAVVAPGEVEDLRIFHRRTLVLHLTHARVGGDWRVWDGTTWRTANEGRVMKALEKVCAWSFVEKRVDSPRDAQLAEYALWEPEYMVQIQTARDTMVLRASTGGRAGDRVNVWSSQRSAIFEAALPDWLWDPLEIAREVVP